MGVLFNSCEMMKVLMMIVGSCLLFGQHYSASPTRYSDLTSSANVMATKEIDSKLIMKILLGKMDSLKDSFDLKLQQVQADVVAVKENTKKEYDSVKTDISEIKSEMQSLTGSYKEAICAYQDYVDNNDQTITYDRVYIEMNDDNQSVLNQETGIFIAGRAGVYDISLTISRARTEDNSQMNILLKTSSGHYQEDHEDIFLNLYSHSGLDNWSPMSGSRFVYLEKGEKLFMDYTCDLDKKCHLDYVKMCISFYSEVITKKSL